MGAAVVYGATVGGLRMVFGRHFFTDIVFSGVFTLVIVGFLYSRLIDPARRNDAKVERAIVRTAAALHGGIAAILGGIGRALMTVGYGFHAAATYIREHVARL